MNQKFLIRIVTLLLIINCSLFIKTKAQETHPFNGPKDQRTNYYAFTNANIVKDYKTVIENAMLIIKDGRVVSIDKRIKVPAGAIEIDLKGKYIYPSFIDLYADYGVPKAKRSQSNSYTPQTTTKKKGAYHWNEAMKPENKAFAMFTANAKTAKMWQSIGFGAVLTHQQDGIARGTSALVTLGNGKENEIILMDEVANHLAFRKGVSRQNYPNSLMGIIALIQQTELDAQWYAQTKNKNEYNASLAAWNANKKFLQIFETFNRLDVLRADKLGDEFGKQYIFKGSGDEYKRLDAIKKTGGKFIIPLNFTKTYDVSDPYAAMNVSLSQMKSWEMDPSNPARLAEAKIEFALTASDLKSKKDFLKNLRKAVKYGLSQEDALKALTFTPANMIGAYNQIGSLEKGKWANFIITSGNIFEDKTIIHQNWIKGKKNQFKALDFKNLNGKYDLYFQSKTHQLIVSGKPEKPSMHILMDDSTKVKVNYKIQENNINLNFNLDKNKTKNVYRLNGTIGNNIWQGNGQNPAGDWFKWISTKNKSDKNSSKKKKKNKKKKGENDTEIPKMSDVNYPFMPYGWTKKPEAKTILIKNTTVWTNEADGILKNTDVLIKDGKIVQIGKVENVAVSETIDGTNKHLTCGIVDEHSHIAISRGVNEGSQVSSAEVSIGNVVNSEDINIYRQLAGGVTTSQLLHGSANPIGGQSAIIKLRWGSLPEEMKFDAAAPFIKFALGENVKQANWGINNTRYPQTRMGVEQIYYDYFIRAKQYGEQKAAGKPYRKDLEMETLLEILESKRFITCHSYVQSEINMLMHVADSMGFTVNTFTHILEGYKVADKMKAHGVGGSTFSDWWAYKYEVIDAIPYNAALMHEQGVTVAINSDDAEMARRLNQEAAKAVKYGGMSEEEAWKTVTLNPAKLLHIDHRVGSIKVGKDADLVLWSDDPLSIYARAEKTFVDGICLYDLTQDKLQRIKIKKERADLIQKMIAAKKGGSKTQKPKSNKKKLYHCDTHEDFGN